MSRLRTLASSSLPRPLTQVFLTMQLISGLARALNTILRPAGVRIVRDTTPTRTFAAFFLHLKRLNQTFNAIIDVGVGNGTPAIYAAYPKAEYILIEPVAEQQRQVEGLSRQLNARVIFAAAGAVNGEVDFNIHDDLTGSSVLKQAEGPLLDGISRRIPCKRLDAILPAHLARPSLLKIDTQGAEIDVLEGLGDRLADIDSMIVETSLLPFRTGAPELGDLVRYLDDRGFVVYDILEGHTRALDGALAQVDLVFVRKDSPLRRDPRFFSSAQAKAYAARWSRLRRA